MKCPPAGVGGFVKFKTTATTEQTKLEQQVFVKALWQVPPVVLRERAAVRREKNLLKRARAVVV